MLKSNTEQYGDVAKTFHWIIALGIISMLAFGFYLETIEGPARGELMGLHKSVGVTILILMIGRICWRIYAGHPAPMDAHARWERLVATVTHYLLYIAAFLMPLSGLLMSNAAGRPVGWFGIPVPTLISPDAGLRNLFGASHSVFAWTLISLISLHILGALKHVFIDKDGTLKRMLP